MNIANHVDRAARHFPDKPAIIFEGRSTTYAALVAAVDRAAHGLVERGVSPGDRVALFLPNIPAFVTAYLAALKAGAVAVSISAALTTDEVEHILDDSGASTVFTSEALLPVLEPLLDRGFTVVVCEGDCGAHVDFESLGAGYTAPFPAVSRQPDDAAAILYTSGTTGRQKGATLSHGNVVSNGWAGGHHMGVTPDDRLLLFLPLFHCFGQNAIANTAFTHGATLVMHRRFAPEEIVASIAEHDVTMFFAVPAVYIGLLHAGVEPAQLASVRYFFSAAATMPVEIAERWQQSFGQTIYEGYGLTETSPFASYNHEWEHRPGSVGTPIENVEVTVLDAESRELAPGEWGEIAIRGPNVMLGYWNRPEETAEALRGGWFHTGDIGYVDDDGFLYLVDRVKDMINCAGFKVWPREVEEVLYRHPAVKECAVVGAPHPVNGESVRAVIVVEPDHETGADDLGAYCRLHLAAYKVPEAFDFVAELPKNPTGKILKRVLREQPVAQLAPSR